MTEARISASQLSKNTGLPTTTIKRIRSNANANPTLVSLLPIAAFFRISLSQLIGEEDIPANIIKGTFSSNQKLWTRVPIITWEQAILWNEKTHSLVCN